MSSYALAIDIETVANDRAEAYALSHERFEAPANYKDPAKIEQAILAKRSASLEKAGLKWWTGKVVEICCIDTTGRLPPRHYFGEDEGKLLTAFGAGLTTDFKDHYMIGKSVLDFDFPFLMGRFLAHDLGIPSQLRPDNSYRLTDVDKIFGYSATSGQRGKLDDYAWGLGITGKTSHGSEVGALYNRILLGEEGAIQQLKDYCQQDTQIVVEMFRRYAKVFTLQGENFSDVIAVIKDFTT
jgi:hypothetical protein